MDKLSELDKADLIYYGRELARRFLEINDQPLIKFKIEDSYNAGYYVSGTGVFGVHGAKSPSKGNFPGYRADTTPIGICARLVGYHIAERRDTPINTRPWAREGKVTTNEMNADDGNIAQAIKLFITNPDVLRVGRPARWRTLTEDLGLRPLHSSDWRTVLGVNGATPGVFTATERWIAENPNPNLKPEPDPEPADPWAKSYSDGCDCNDCKMFKERERVRMMRRPVSNRYTLKAPF